MRRLSIVTALVLLFVPGWSGQPGRTMFQRDLIVRATPYTPPGGWPHRIGILAPIGAVALRAGRGRFGGFSALALYRGQVVLLSDLGQVVWLRLHDGKVRAVAGSALRDGPGTGWSPDTRDAESLAIDPATGRSWIGYERANAIWRYGPDLDRAEAGRRPAAMRNWGINSGIESLARLPDGRFLALREGGLQQVGARPALLFDGDPTDPRMRIAGLRYLPPAGYATSDAAALPNGDVLVLNRRWQFPLRFDMVLTRISGAQIRAGAVLSGPIVARFGSTLDGGNAEGIAVAHQRGRTTIWIVTDNDGASWRRTILAAFHLIG